jgi:diguanylate cyclase (GGDEF)-like protein
LQAIATSLNDGLVVISVLISIVASYAAFSFAERLVKSAGIIFAAWFVSGSLAMGLGIWSMHYLGMLAVRLPIVVYYHVPTVLLSLSLAVLASMSVLLVVSRPKLSKGQLTVGSLVMGSGIGAMHYTGMHAMRCAAIHRYQPVLVLLSILVAVGFSWGALWIAFAVRYHGERRERLRIGGAVLMGTGIAGMHYTAMSAVTFWPDSISFSTQHTVQITTIGVVAVAVTTGVVLLGALVTALVDRTFYEKLRRERDRLHAVAECSLDCLYFCESVRGPEGAIEDFLFTFVNGNVEKTTGIPLNDLLGAKMCQVMPHIREAGHFALYLQVVASGEPMTTEFSLLDKEQNPMWLQIRAVKLHDGLVISTSDITARKRDEAHMLYLAHHDPLTGLINRSLLHDRIDQAIERAVRYNNMVGVFLIDLDGFKQINDTLGHFAGDSVLIGVAGRLKTAVRAIDSVIRIGGDEFVVVMPEMGTWKDVENCGLKFLDAFRPPGWVNGKSFHVTCSIGASFYPGAGATATDLLAAADSAMYAAKRSGKNHLEIFRPDSDPEPAIDLSVTDRVQTT